MGESLIILELSEVFAPKIKFKGAEDIEIHCYQYRCLANKILSSVRIFLFNPEKSLCLFSFFFFLHSCLFSAFTQDVNIRIRKLLMVYYYFRPRRKLALTSLLICECNSSCSCQSSRRSSKTGNSPGHPTCGHNGFKSLGLHRRQGKTQITK